MPVRIPISPPAATITSDESSRIVRSLSGDAADAGYEQAIDQGVPVLRDLEERHAQQLGDLLAAQQLDEGGQPRRAGEQLGLVQPLARVAVVQRVEDDAAGPALGDRDTARR